MLIKIKHALLEILNYPYNKISAVIINDNLILATGIILEPYLNSFDSNYLFNKLLNSNLVQLNKINDRDNDNNKKEHYKLIKNLNSLKFQITFDEKQFNEASNHILTKYSANLLYIFNSHEIQSCLKNIFKKFHQNTDDKFDEMNSILYSSFILLSFDDCTTSVAQQNQQKKIDNILRKLISYCKFLPQINKLDDIMSICTPFALENFYKTVNFGKISNIIGPKQCLFICSNNFPHGCEGSAVFNNKLRLIGILICTTWVRNNENYNLTLVANFEHIIRIFAKQYGMKYGNNWILKQPSYPTWEKSLVLILANGSQGTGTFVKVFDKKFILTCSHVVNKSDPFPIKCRYIEGTFESKIIWRNQNCNEPFDVALLDVPKSISSDYFVGLSSERPYLGQNVFNAGFPFFTNFTNESDIEFTPAIYDGKIIKCNQGVIISNARLQNGQSGGPMFDEKGTVLGVCVSNLKLEDVVYPNINTSIPVFEIKKTLESYAKSNGNFSPNIFRNVKLKTID